MYIITNINKNEWFFIQNFATLNKKQKRNDKNYSSKR